MHNKILFYSAKHMASSTSHEGILPETHLFGAKNNAVHQRILETQAKEIHMLEETPHATKAMMEHNKLQNVTPRNLYMEYYWSTAKTMKSWKDVYDDIDVSQLSDYDALYITGCLDAPKYRFDRFSHDKDTFPINSNGLSDNDVGEKIIQMVAMLKAHRTYGMPLHMNAQDPRELTFSVIHPNYRPIGSNFHEYHGFDIPRYNMNRLDSQQYFYSFDKNRYLEKDLGLAAAYTAWPHAKRDHLLGLINAIAPYFGESFINFTTVETGIKNIIPKDEYIDILKRAKYTYVLPSYDYTVFSIHRVVEALHHDCLPLISKAANIQEVNKSFDVDLSPLIRSVPFESEQEWRDTLEHYRNKMLVVERNYVQ